MRGVIIVKINTDITKGTKIAFVYPGQGAQYVGMGKDFYEKITALDYLKGKKVFCRINDEERQIEVLGIDRDCSLKVLCDGIVRNLSSSEITFHI